MGVITAESPYHAQVWEYPPWATRIPHVHACTHGIVVGHNNIRDPCSQAQISMTHGLPFDFYRKGGKIFWKKGLFSIFTKKLFVSDLLSRKRLFSIYLYIMKISLFPLHQNKIYSLCKKPQIVAPLVGVSKVHLITTTSLSCGCCSFMS